MSGDEKAGDKPKRGRPVGSKQEKKPKAAPMPRMVGRPCLLTPEVELAIVTRVGQGAFAWVAAALSGVSPTTYMRWIARGKEEVERAEAVLDEGGEPDPITMFGRFYMNVTQARAHARYGAEKEVYEDNKLAWLLKGPGRDRPGEPGWTDKVEVTGADAGPVKLAASAMDLSLLSEKDLDDLERIQSKLSVAPLGSDTGGKVAP